MDSPPVPENSGREESTPARPDSAVVEKRSTTSTRDKEAKAMPAISSIAVLEESIGGTVEEQRAVLKSYEGLDEENVLGKLGRPDAVSEEETSTRWEYESKKAFGCYIVYFSADGRVEWVYATGYY
jgi:hypothetical protein